MTTSQEKAGKKYKYANEAAGRIIEVDTIIDGDLLTIIPECDECVIKDGIRQVRLSPDKSVDELIRECTETLLDGFDLTEIQRDTTEIEMTVLREMRKTPISLRDGEYEKEFLDAMVLCLDLRQFSSYARDDSKTKVKGFLEKYTQELLAAINSYSVSYYKLLGDGALVLWDRPAKEDLDNAVELFTLLRSVIGEIGSEYGYHNNLAGAVVVDEVYKYEIYAESSGLKYRDYVGYGINYAFRLQAIAGSEELLCNRSVVERFGLGLDELAADKKPKREAMKGIRDEDYDDIYVVVPSSDRI